MRVQADEASRAALENLKRIVAVDGLYQSIDLTDEAGIALAQAIDNKFTYTFDLFCPTCKMVTTYQTRYADPTVRPISTRYQPTPITLGFVVINAVCLRQEHYFTAIFKKTVDCLIKIGQFPSLAEVAFGELSHIDRALTKEDRKELGRALGLFAHDAPLGAFVYLRRVFERMILRAHERHVSEVGSPIEGFVNMAMDQRIRALKGQLPAKVVQNSAVFQVLSLGIHELSDDDARDLFPVVKSVIFQMLGDEERHRQEREQEAATDAAFAQIMSRLNAPAKLAAIEDLSADSDDVAAGSENQAQP